MNNLTTIETMTSLQIAEITGKPHNDVLKAIRKMEDAWVKINGGNFSLVEYTDNKGEKRPCYSLTKTECLYIATKFNDEARAKLVIRWEELESEKMSKEKTINFDDPDTVLLLAGKWKEEKALRLEAEQKALQLENLNKEQKPKVAFANAMLASNTSCLIGELAKVLTQNGYTIGQNRLFAYLRENGYLCKAGERYNQPRQEYIEQGLFEIKHSTRSGNDGVQHITNTTKVTPKGQQYFINKFTMYTF